MKYFVDLRQIDLTCGSTLNKPTAVLRAQFQLPTTAGVGTGAASAVPIPRAATVKASIAAHIPGVAAFCFFNFVSFSCDFHPFLKKFD